MQAECQDYLGFAVCKVSTASPVRHQHHQTDRRFFHGRTRHFSPLPPKRTVGIIKVQIHCEAQRPSPLHAVHSALNETFAVRREQPSIVADLHVIAIIAIARQHLSEFAEVKTSNQSLNYGFDENQLLEVFACGLLITCHLKLFAPRLGTRRLAKLKALNDQQ